MSQLDETKITDFDPEIARFDELLGTASRHRVMVISGQAGAGKTDLLRKIRLHCQRDLGIPVALVSLKEFVNRPDEYVLVTRLHRELQSTGARLPRFDALDDARGRGDASAFADRPTGATGAVDMAGATVSGNAIVGGTVTVIQHAANVVLPSWSEAIEAYARARCIDAFLTDLVEHAQGGQIVLLFDSLESGGDLQRWILMEIVSKLVLEAPERPGLTVTVAGQDAAGLVLGRLRQAHHALVDCVDSFNPWSEQQIVAFLAAHGHRNVTQNLLAVIGVTLGTNFDRSRALAVAQILAAQPALP